MFKIAVVALLCLFANVAFGITVTNRLIGRRWYVAGRFDNLLNEDGTKVESQNIAFYSYDRSADEWKWAKLADKVEKYNATSDSWSAGWINVVTVMRGGLPIIGGDFDRINFAGATRETGPAAVFTPSTQSTFSSDGDWQNVIPNAVDFKGVVHAITFDCSSGFARGSRLCDIYLGGEFTFTATDPFGEEKEFVNVVRRRGTDGGLFNLGNHPIRGPVYAIYQKGFGTGASANFLWVGGDLKAEGSAKYFGRFERVKSSNVDNIQFVNLDGDAVNGIVRSFAYQRSFIRDILYLAGDFDFVADGEVCSKQCMFNWSTRKFSSLSETTFNGPIYNIDIQRSALTSVRGRYFVGAFSEPANLVARQTGPIDSNDPRPFHSIQEYVFTSNYSVGLGLDVCSYSDIGCNSGSASVSTSSGDLKFFDIDNFEFEDFLGGIDVPEGHGHHVRSISSTSAGATTYLSAAVVAVVALAFAF